MKSRSYINRFLVLLLATFPLFSNGPIAAETPKTNILVLTERGGQHEGFTKAALAWLDTFALNHSFVIKEVHHTLDFTDAFLATYKVIIQLDYPPYTWSDSAKAAFTKYIDEGRGGWVGFHHAALLGDFDGYPMWNWFSDFMGDLRFDNYIAETVSGEVHVEDPNHPVMKGVTKSFLLQKEEWYTFQKSPRAHVHVLANVDESSYQPTSSIKMGDHPVIWVNEHKSARNVYFLMGHHAVLFESESFKTLFSNAILWVSGK